MNEPTDPVAPAEPTEEERLVEAFQAACRHGDADALEQAAVQLHQLYGYRGLELARLAQTADRRRYAREVSPLTEREVTVLTLAALGMDNTEIGKRLHLARSTVNTYLDRCYEKLGVRNRTGAAVRALSHGWISMDQFLGEEREKS